MARIRLSTLVPLLLATSTLHAAPITQGAPGAVPPEQFRIMTDTEIAEHQAKMATLSGTAREDYRNNQYQMLKERAQAQGYLLPDTPPWGRTAVVPASQSTTEAPSDPAVSQANTDNESMQQLIAEQKRVVQQAMQGSQEAPAPAAPAPAEPAATASPASAPAPAPQAVAAPQAPVAATVDPAPAVPPVAADTQAAAGAAEGAAASQANKEYRSAMKERFDNFMSQRDARQQEQQAQRERERASLEEKRKQYAEQVEQRRQAYRARVQQQQQVPTYQQPVYPAPAYQVPQPYSYPQQAPYQPAPYYR